MNIRKKIVLYFSAATTLVIGVAFIFIYILSSARREEEFQQRQKEKIVTTLELLDQIRQIDGQFIKSIDRLTINDLYDEKMLLFNRDKELIYSSIDDMPVSVSRELLSTLNPDNKWIETKEGLYDVIGTYIEGNGNIYYGISKAYDTFGYTKLRYLKYVLIATFGVVTLVTFLIALYLSKKITEPLLAITHKINNYHFDQKYIPIEVKSSKDEITLLAQQFNKLMKRMNEVFAFQKHAVHHISHQLKTPIAILVSNFEKIEEESDKNKIQILLKNQKEDTKSLSEIINSLLEIAKAETGSTVLSDPLRVDELIFDIAAALKMIHPSFQFSIEYIGDLQERDLLIMANQRLLKAALTNLMDNCVQYSDDGTAKISMMHKEGHVAIAFKNHGPAITDQENRFLFQHFFRGANSTGKRGFGLGLVFVYKIISLHHGAVNYQSLNGDWNVFEVLLPLRSSASGSQP